MGLYNATKPLVSVITPTRGREKFLPLVYSCFETQDWPNLEWLIDDDSPEVSAFMKGLTDTRIKYHHNPSRRSVGLKRNELVSRASGQYIVHFDDDDYYGAGYVSHYVQSMSRTNADCVKLCGFFIYDRSCRKFFYWDQTQTRGMHFVCKHNQPRRIVEIASEDDREFAKFRLGYGFSYAYRRTVWNSVKFPDVDFCEDLAFMSEAAKVHSVVLLPDTMGLCLHVIHSANVSGCFPQYLIPSFMLTALFPQATAYYSQGG